MSRDLARVESVAATRTLCGKFRTLHPQEYPNDLDHSSCPPRCGRFVCGVGCGRHHRLRPIDRHHGSPVQPVGHHGSATGQDRSTGRAFKKLDPSAKGYVSKEDAAQLQGFDTAFQRADANKDGKLTPSEFNQAWAIYSGSMK